VRWDSQRLGEKVGVSATKSFAAPATGLYLVIQPVSDLGLDPANGTPPQRDGSWKHAIRNTLVDRTSGESDKVFDRRKPQDTNRLTFRQFRSGHDRAPLAQASVVVRRNR
jgi:hypothetical protein